MKSHPWMIVALTLAAAGLWLGRNGLAQQNDALLQDDAATQIDERLDTFFRDVGKGDVKPALEDLLQGSPLNGGSKRVTDLRDAIRRELPKYGSFLGAEQVKLERIGRSVIRCVYLYRAQDFPVVWHFTFYHPEGSKDWTVIALKFDVDYDRLPSSS